MAIIDSIKTEKQEETKYVDTFNSHENVHYNIPLGNDAKRQYRFARMSVRNINPKGYGDINKEGNFEAFDEARRYLCSLLEYYEGIAEVYKTKDYIANDESIFEKSYYCDTQCARISDEEKQLVSDLIEAIENKLSQMGDHEYNCYY